MNRTRATIATTRLMNTLRGCAGDQTSARRQPEH
jgi:hypothetical protein